MKFQYSFQKVLDVKSNEKKQTETMLAQAIAELVEAERTLAELEEERRKVLERLNEDALRGQAMAGLIAGQQYVDFLDDSISRTVRRLREAERKAEEVRGMLLERSVEEKVWQKAKEKAYEDFRIQAERQHQNELDEIATVRSRFAQ